jgi:hypothetical protein
MGKHTDFGDNVRVLRDTNARVGDGTSLMDYVETTFASLLETFGEPTTNGDGYKVRVEWILETPIGVATIYDWKESNALANTRDWHIGGTHTDVVDYVRYALNGDIEVVGRVQPVGYDDDYDYATDYER